ncbi:MAG: ABC transporter substrate-binding protein [Candidatus Eremiobacteraeota bacterium]|nr:ABC transporter substrate-binding protein [Candidatus Eremiobacteraeota bacterium]
MSFRILPAVLAAAFVLSGCGSPAPEVRQSLGGEQGPVLVVARVKDAVNLDPAQASEGMSLNISTEIMKGLVQFHIGTFDVEPAIARSWKMSPDGRIWTFTLKQGLKFSDGTPVDAEAVKFNFDRWRLLSNPYHGDFSYPYYATMFGGFPGLITDVQAPASDTLIFTLARPFAPFLHDLAMPNFAIGSPRAIRNDLSGFGLHPVGWGPYTLTAWVKQQYIKLAANPDYEVRPEYRTVIVLDVPDQATTVNDMERERVDVVTNPGPKDIDVLSHVPGVTIYYEPANNDAYLAMNNDRFPFNKLAVRQAVAYAMDVRTIVRNYYPAGADVADNWTPRGMLGENPNVKAYPVDLVRARSLLAHAGFPHGFTTQLAYSDTPRPYLPEPRKTAEEIKRDLARIGINVELQAYNFADFLDRIHNGEHAMALVGWISDNGDPDNFLYTLLDPDSARRPNALNYAFWRDQRFHQLMLQGQATSDPIERGRIYQEANAMVHDMVPSIPIVHVTSPDAVRTAVAGYVPSPTSSIAFEYMRPIGYGVGF